MLKPLIIGLAPVLIFNFAAAFAKEYVFPPLEQDVVDTGNNAANRQIDASYPNQDYGQAQERSEPGQNRSSFFARPDYQFPPSQTPKSNPNTFGPYTFPPLEEPAEPSASASYKTPYSAPKSYSEPAYTGPREGETRASKYDYPNPYAGTYDKPSKRSYPYDKNYPSDYRRDSRNRSYGNNYYGDYGNPFNYMMPFQNSIPGFNPYGNNVWGPNGGNFMNPFGNYPGMDFRNMTMPGFFSR